MASTNQSPQYQKAESKFLEAQTDKEKLTYLDEMIRECPKHKSAEKMLAQLKIRRKKLLEKIEKSKKKGRRGKQGIKKEEMQAAIVGIANSGKSSLLSSLTNVEPEISPFPFNTKKPIIGMMPFSGTQIQLVEIPAINSEYYDRGVANTADTILVIVNKLEQIEKILPKLSSNKPKIIIYNVKNSEENLRKISETLKSKKYNFVIINTKTKEGLEELKEKIFSSFGKIRIFTKEPGKEKSEKPMILELNSIVKDIAEKILKNLSDLRETKIWGPSSKFPGQVVGITHKLKDLDVVEFRTR